MSSRHRRLVITVCPNEPGVVTLPLERGGRARRLDARAVARHLEALAAKRGVGERVTLRSACAGGCSSAGPNVGVTIYPDGHPGEAADHVAIGWKTYVYSLRELDCLARVIDENLKARI
jgi:hypothetical protein